MHFGAEYEAEVVKQARAYQQRMQHQAQLPSSDALFNLLVQGGMSVQVGPVTPLFFFTLFSLSSSLPTFFFT